MLINPRLRTVVAIAVGIAVGGAAGLGVNTLLAQTAGTSLHVRDMGIGYS